MGELDLPKVEIYIPTKRPELYHIHDLFREFSFGNQPKQYRKAIGMKIGISTCVWDF
jgi:hypothetical protein